MACLVLICVLDWLAVHLHFDVHSVSLERLRTGKYAHVQQIEVRWQAGLTAVGQRTIILCYVDLGITNEHTHSGYTIRRCR